MTSTVPLLRPVRRVYGARIRDLGDGTVRIDYVGKTRRLLAVREAEHRGLGRNPEDEQPWSDLVVEFVTLESDEGLDVPWTDEELADRERWWIRNAGGLLPHRPRYNWEFNAGCPGQIPKWTAAEQRRQRDVARGVVSRWTDPELFLAREPRPVPPRPVPSHDVPHPSWVRLAAARVGRWASRKARAAARRVAPWLGLWLALCVAGLVLGVPDAPAAAAAMTVLGLLAWVGRTNKKTTPTRRPSKRRTR